MVVVVVVVMVVVMVVVDRGGDWVVVLVVTLVVLVMASVPFFPCPHTVSPSSLPSSQSASPSHTQLGRGIKIMKMLEKLERTNCWRMHCPVPH